MTRFRRLRFLSILLVATAQFGAIVVPSIWLPSWSPSPDPITQLDGSVRTEKVYRNRINEFLDRVWPGFSPRRDGFSRQAVVEVNLNRTQADNETLEYVRRFQSLEQLLLDGTQVDDDGLAHIARLPDLTILSLDQTAVTDAGLAYLATHPRLQVLMLSQTAVGDRGLKQISRMPVLGDLHLMETDISDAGLRSLQHLSTLQALQLGGNPRVTHTGIRQLVDAVPGLTVNAYEEEPEGRYTVRRLFSSKTADQPDGVVDLVI